MADLNARFLRLKHGLLLGFNLRNLWKKHIPPATQNFCAYRKIIYTASRQFLWSLVCSSPIILTEFVALRKSQVVRSLVLINNLITRSIPPSLMQQLSFRTQGNALTAKGTTTWPVRAPFEHNPRMRKQSTCRHWSMGPGNKNRGSTTEKRSVK